MILLEDSRNKVGEHQNIYAYCERMGIKIVRQKLDVGDYAFPGGNISVDTKRNILELAQNICSSDHARFRAECNRALECKIQLVILVEEIPPYGKVDLWEIPKWKTSNRFHRIGDPMTKIDPRALRKAMITMWKKYGVWFEFCTRRQSPARVIKILKGELR